MQKQRLALLAALLSTACHSPSTEDQIVAGLAARSAPSTRSVKKPPPLPQGIGLLVMPGQGVGPIRIGARVSTIERLMQARCEVLSEHLCRYVDRGVDFHLVGGVTQWIHVQRASRPAGKSASGDDREFGFFNGLIPPDLRLGMLPQVIQEKLGKPYRAEKVAEPNPQNMVWRHYYPGMILEYDRWAETGKLVLGGIRIVKDDISPPDAGVAPDAGAAADAGSKPPPARDAGPPRPEPEPR